MVPIHNFCVLKSFCLLQGHEELFSRSFIVSFSHLGLGFSLNYFSQKYKTRGKDSCFHVQIGDGPRTSY